MAFKMCKDYSKINILVFSKSFIGVVEEMYQNSLLLKAGAVS